MSIEAMSFVLNKSMGKGNGAHKLVLLGFANHADRHGHTAYPSIATVAEYADCDPKTVRRHVTWLLQNGYLREGDQRHVAHLPPDRKPIVYDLAMSDEKIREWSENPPEDGARKTHVANGSKSRGDNLSPRPRSERGDNSDQAGGQLEPTGGTPVSPKPSLEPSLEPPTVQPVLDVEVGQNPGSPTGGDQPKTDPDEDCRFDEFWSVYPRRTGKGQARAAWRKAIRKTTVGAILKGAIQYRDDPNREQQFTKHPSTWLNGECWEDDPLPAKCDTPRLASNGYWPGGDARVPTVGSSYWPS